jgi:tetratricopeptide (TPR) repeat protein
MFLDDTIDDLVKYALVKRKSLQTSLGETKSLWIHPIVQIWARESYCQEGNVILARDPKHVARLRKEGARKAVCLIGSGLKTEYYERGPSEWIYERENMAHLRMCFDEYIPNYITGHDDIADESLAFAVRKLAGLKVYWSEYRLAVDLLWKSIGIYELLLSNDPEVEIHMLFAKQILISIYLGRDKLDTTPNEVKVMIDEVVLRQRSLLGDLHWHTLWTVTLQAAWLLRQERIDESMVLFEKCLGNNRKVLEPGHVINIATMAYLSLAYYTKKENDKALELSEECVALCLEYLGLDQQETLLRLEFSAYLRLLSGNLAGCCEFRQVVAERYEANMGLASEDTLKAILELRETYILMKRFDDTLQATEKFLEGYRIRAGKENPQRDSMFKEIEERRIEANTDASILIQARERDVFRTVGKRYY